MMRVRQYADLKGISENKREDVKCDELTFVNTRPIMLNVKLKYVVKMKSAQLDRLQFGADKSLLY